MFLPDNSVFVPVTDPDMRLTKTPVPVLAPGERLHSAAEAEANYTPEQAMAEARRCLHCPAEYCRKGCPVGNPIPDFTAKLRAGDFEGAYQLIAASNCLPGLSGRVCPQECQCEGACTRGINGEPVAIGRLERFVADWHRQQAQSLPPKPAPCGKSAAVIGSGPAGLTCALELAGRGWAVTLYEARPYLGGIPAYGIPAFVLPREVLAEKLALLTHLGVTVKTGVTVGRDVTLPQLAEQFDGVFAACGCAKPVTLSIPGQELAGVYTATDYLTAVNVDGAAPAARRVVVVGGGNTAVDVARCALRAGAEEVTIVYRRDEGQMPARPGELRLAREEGVKLLPLATPTAILGVGKVTGLCCAKMALGPKDWPGGRPQPVPSGEPNFSLEADAVVLALGYTADPLPGLPTDDHGRVQVAKDGVTTPLAKVYAGGDAVTGPATLIRAVAAGKKVAQILCDNGQ